MTGAQIVAEEANPASLHAEITILGAVLVEPTVWEEAAAKLQARDFVLDSHRRIFRAMQALAAENKPIDLVTLAEMLRTTRELDAIGGLPYLASLSEGLPRKLNITSYVSVVKSYSLAREILRMCDRTMLQVTDKANEPEDVLAELQEEVFAILAEEATGGAVAVAEVVPKVVERVLREREQTAETLGLTTGLRTLNYKTGGLRKNEYTILAAESGGGKTAFAVQLTVENALLGVPCLWFSLEMTKEQLVSRMFSSASYSPQGFGPQVKAVEMRDPRRIARDHMHDFYRVGDKVAELPVWIDDDAALELPQMIARARLWVRERMREAKDVDEQKLLMMVDYIQLVAHADAKLTDAQRVEKVTFALRDLAKTEPVHVIGLSQFSYDGRLKHSSSLRHSCQNLLLLEMEKLEGEFTGNAAVRVDKNREGGIGKVVCKFNPDFLRFYEA